MGGKEDQGETLKANPEHPSNDDVQTPLVSSRLCIKNLPKHYTEVRFREHFSTIGEVTDCVIKNTHGGTDDISKRSSWQRQHRKQQQTSRCLGFIGYKTEKMAILAQKYFHNTFIDTSRIDVSFAASRKERAALSERSSWSKYSAGTSANERLKREEEKKLKKKNKEDEDDGKKEEKKDPNRFIGVRERIKMEKAAKLKKEQFVSPEEKMLEEKMREDPKLREYMALMLPKSKFAAKFWSDGLVHEEDEYLSGGPAQTKLADIEDTEGGNANEDSDDDEYQDLENDDSSDDNSSSSDDEEEIEDSDSDDVKKDDAVSDMEYLKAKRGNFSSDSEDSEEDEEEENSSDDDDDDDDENNSEKSSDDEGKEFSLENDDDVDNTEKKRSSKKSKDGEKATIKEVEVVQASDMESLQETGRVFLRNLPYTCTEEEIFDHMQSHVGKLTAVHVLVDKSTKQSKGLAYATFALPEDGVKCIDVLDGAIFQGRILHVLPAKRAPTNAEKNTLGGVGRITVINDDNREDNDDENDPNNNSYKKQKEHMRKADAADKKAWNALFMRQDTVLSAVAAMYGVDKGDLLSTETEDVAVRVALGEAQVIANTKKELGDVGVNVHALESASGVERKCQNRAFATFDFD